MKKRGIVLCLAMIALVITFGISALAASRYRPDYCDQCGTLLSEAGTHISGYSDTHPVPSTDQNNPDTCHVAHDISLVERFCPNGHGVKWSGIWHKEWHSNPICPDNGYWE